MPQGMLFSLEDAPSCKTENTYSFIGDFSKEDALSLLRGGVKLKAFRFKTTECYTGPWYFPFMDKTLFIRENVVLPFDDSPLCPSCHHNMRLCAGGYCLSCQEKFSTKLHKVGKGKKKEILSAEI